MYCLTIFSHKKLELARFSAFIPRLDIFCSSINNCFIEECNNFISSIMIPVLLFITASGVPTMLDAIYGILKKAASN